MLRFLRRLFGDFGDSVPSTTSATLFARRHRRHHHHHHHGCDSGRDIGAVRARNAHGIAHEVRTLLNDQRRVARRRPVRVSGRLCDAAAALCRDAAREHHRRHRSHSACAWVGQCPVACQLRRVSYRYEEAHVNTAYGIRTASTHR